MALKLGELVAILKTDDRPLEKGLDDGKRKMRQAGQAMEGDAATAASGIARQWGAGGARGADAFVREAGGRLRDSKGRFTSDADAAGRAAGDGFTRGADGRLRDGRGRFVATGQEMGSAAGKGIVGGLSAAVSSVGTFTSALGTALGPVGSLATAFLAVGSAAAFAAPLIGVLGGALGSLPGLIGGLGALTATLGIGFMGLGDAFKKTAGGGAGGAMVDRAYQIAQAERRLRDANEEVTASQDNLTRARERAAEAQADLTRAEQRAAEQLEDLDRQVRGAHISQERAAIRVTEANLAYQNALRKPWDAIGIKKAKNDLDDAKLATEEAADRVDDLGKEQADAAKKGIKGSDEVRAAQERHRAAVDEVTAARKRERAAVEGVADAEHALAQARKPAGGGGGGAGAEVTKLSKSAREAVAAIKGLKPAFESLRLDIQERLFKGVGDRIREVADAWLPTLHQRLGGMATMVNGLFHNLGESVSKPKFIAGVSAGMLSVEQMIDRIGRSITGPFMDAWGRLSAKAGPFILQLGEEIGSLVDDFSEWIKAADDSGDLESFFQRASGYLHDIFTIGRDVGGIIGGIVSAIWGDGKTDENPLQAFHGTLVEVRTWVDANQAKIHGFFEQMGGLIGKAVEAVGWLVTNGDTVSTLVVTIGTLIGIYKTWIIVQGIINVLMTANPIGLLIVGIGLVIAGIVLLATKTKFFQTVWGNVWGWVKNTAGAAKDWIVGKFNALVSWFGGMKNKIASKASGMWDGIKNSFRSAVNWLISKWNNLSFGISGGSFMGMSWGPMRMDTPDISYLAQGGIVPATPGGRLAVIGEGGQDEAVMPLSKLREMFGRMVLELRSSGSAIDDFLIEILRGAIKPRGGNVQVVLGQ